MVGICHLTDSHHYHHGQKPTRVGICHGGNMLGNHYKIEKNEQIYLIQLQNGRMLQFFFFATSLSKAKVVLSYCH